MITTQWKMIQEFVLLKMYGVEEVMEDICVASGRLFEIKNKRSTKLYRASQRTLAGTPIITMRAQSMNVYH